MKLSVVPNLPLTLLNSSVVGAGLMINSSVTSKKFAGLTGRTAPIFANSADYFVLKKAILNHLYWFSLLQKTVYDYNT